MGFRDEEATSVGMTGRFFGGHVFDGGGEDQADVGFVAY